MEKCLYDPEFGYYRRGWQVVGRSGDYITSPHIHRLFAELLVTAFCSYDLRLGRPDPFHLVELGAGEGVLAKDLLQTLEQEHPDLHRRTSYVAVEVASGELPTAFHGVVFSNEFFDALPVHRVRVASSGLVEIYVVSEGDRFREVEGELSDPRIRSFMELGFPCWREGWCYEVNLRMLEVLADLDQHLAKGAVITIDYGFDRAEYDAVERSEGTLLCYFRHQVRADPYRRVGEQDMTAHVNFEVMKRFGEARNWKNLPLKTQRKFLVDWGLEEKLLEEESRGLLATDRLEDRLAMKTLLIPGGISDTLKVQIQEVRMPEQGGHQDA